MKHFSIFVGLAMGAIFPSLAAKIMGWSLQPLIATAVFGVAVLAAGFMLSWGAEAAERHISQGLILAIVALITVLPEYAVDMYYAFQAGRAPDSKYIHYAAANMTGANRMLVGLAWPVVMILHWWRSRERAILLLSPHSIEIGFLLFASLYSFVILFKNRIDLFDFVALFVMFGCYLWQVGRSPKPELSEGAEDEDGCGPASALATLPPQTQWTWITALVVVATIAILVSAEPFAEAIVASGRVLGIDEFLLVQWLAPIASEAPAISIAILFVLSRQPESALTAMISDKINQWTLLVGMLPLAMSFGASDIVTLPLDGRQHEEFFLTASQSIFGLSLLIRLRFSLWSGLVLFVMFAAQVTIAFKFRGNEAHVISSLTILSWTYLGLAFLVFWSALPGLISVVKATLRGAPVLDQ